MFKGLSRVLFLHLSWGAIASLNMVAAKYLPLQTFKRMACHSIATGSMEGWYKGKHPPPQQKRDREGWEKWEPLGKNV